MGLDVKITNNLNELEQISKVEDTVRKVHDIGFPKMPMTFKKRISNRSECRQHTNNNMLTTILDQEKFILKAKEE